MLFWSLQTTEDSNYIHAKKKLVKPIKLFKYLKLLTLPSVFIYDGIISSLGNDIIKKNLYTNTI